MPFCLKSRRDWFAGVPLTSIPPLRTPVSLVLVAYTSKQYRHGKRSPGPRPSDNEIINELIYLQRGDKYKWSDIRYNFMIGPNGCVYEGRGWTTTASLPLKFQHILFNALYICYVGDYTEMAPPDETFQARDELLKFGVENGFISKKFFLVKLRQPETFKNNFEDYIK